MLRPIITSLLLSAAVAMPAAVVTTGSGRLVYSTDVPEAGKIDIVFAPCMANELFTFSSVSVNSTVVNETNSDNIGPFGLGGLGWSGGNHLNEGMRSARTESVAVEADGLPLGIERQDTVECRRLKITVVNTLLMPADTVPFAKETVVYTVAENSIEVDAHHEFVNTTPLLIDRYYGMQSMMVGETEILTPGGEYSHWTPINEVDRFTRGSAPMFCTFIEHSPAAYQACWLDPSLGLGDRHMVDDNDWAFIGNSSSKSYHKTIGSRHITAGDSTRWHGIYSWFDRPLVDGCTKTRGAFAYPGSANGRKSIFYIDRDGRTSIIPLP